MTSSKENTGITKLFNSVANACALNMSLANEADPNERRSISYKLHKTQVPEEKDDDDESDYP